MTTWILSILGIVVLGVLVDIIMPEGDTSKYIKGTFALITVFVIVYPVPGLLKREWNFDFSTTVSTDVNYLHNINTQNAKAIEQVVDKVLKDNNIAVTFVVVNFTPFSTNFNIESINIFLNSGSKASTDSVVNLVKTVVNIPANQIIVFR